MSYVTIPSSVWRQVVNDLAFLKKSILPLAKSHKPSQWIDEDEVISITGYSKKTIYNLRKNGTFNWSTATGRKIKYLRKDVENYINKNSTIS